MRISNASHLPPLTTCQGRWRTFDITPQSLGLPNIMLDFPDLAVESSISMSPPMDFAKMVCGDSSILLRIAIESINRGSINAQQTKSAENFSFRVAQNAGTRVFWASHTNTSSLATVRLG